MWLLWSYMCHRYVPVKYMKMGQDIIRLLIASVILFGCMCGYMALMEISEPFIYIPYFLGWYSQASAQLPVRMAKPSPTGTGTVIYSLSYTFDEDGYVTSMTWNEGKDEYIVEYIYR